ncbi:RNA cytosine C(5)-methyltransferase NSUN2 [Physcia stellaris]|nr:RNA cytosine C(5)-methyltransferase NSUN2 [Physcia stellaris]
MASQSRPLTSSLRHPSIGGSQASTQSPLLVARINEKKIELEGLKQLRDLSAGLAMQMQTLEEKLSTLSDGTQAVAAVLSNWHNVLRAINMASSKLSSSNDNDGSGSGEQGLSNPKTEINLPRTLVRIPFEIEMQHDTAREEGVLSTAVITMTDAGIDTCASVTRPIN